MGFSRQEYWNGFPFPPPGDLPHPAIEPRSSALQADSLPSEPPGKPWTKTRVSLKDLLRFSCTLLLNNTLKNGSGCNCIWISGQPIRLTRRVQEGKQKLKNQKESPQRSSGSHLAACIHTACGARFQELQVTPTSGKTSLICPEASFKVGTKPGDTEITSQSKGKFLAFLGSTWKESKIATRIGFM